MNSTDNILNRIDLLILIRIQKECHWKRLLRLALAVTNIDVGKQIELHRDFEALILLVGSLGIFMERFWT